MIDKMNRQRIGGEGQVSVIKLTPQPELAALYQRKQRVAAYCRVSTDDKEQLSSYQNQMAYYTDKIKTTPSWEFAGIFADEGITGTNALKRDEFQKMIRKCRRGGIDIILTKSISRFARNTMDCLKYIRELKGLGSPSSSSRVISTPWKAKARSSLPCWAPWPRRKARTSATT